MSNILKPILQRFFKAADAADTAVQKETVSCSNDLTDLLCRVLARPYPFPSDVLLRRIMTSHFPQGQLRALVRPSPFA
jgi:hypothetical protein